MKDAILAVFKRTIQLLLFSRSVLSNSFCNPVDCNPPGSSVFGISQARILDWVTTSFCRDLPDPGVVPTSPALAGGLFTTESPGSPVQLCRVKNILMVVQTISRTFPSCTAEPLAH